MPSTRSVPKHGLNHREQARAARLNSAAVLVFSLAVAIVLVVVLGMAVHHALASLADHLNSLQSGQQNNQ